VTPANTTEERRGNSFAGRLADSAGMANLGQHERVEKRTSELWSLKKTKAVGVSRMKLKRQNTTEDQVLTNQRPNPKSILVEEGIDLGLLCRVAIGTSSTGFRDGMVGNSCAKTQLGVR